MNTRLALAAAAIAYAVDRAARKKRQDLLRIYGARQLAAVDAELIRHGFPPRWTP